MSLKTSKFCLMGFSIFLALCFLSASQIQKETSTSDISNLQSDTLAARQLLQQEKILTAEKKYESSIEALEQASNLYQKHQMWRPAIGCLIKVAKLADNFNEQEVKTEFKNKYSKLALKLSRQYLSKGDTLLAASFRQKAEGLMMLERFDSAHYFLTQAIPIFEVEEKWVDLGWSETILGVNYFQQSKLDSCKSHLLKAQEILSHQILPQKDQTEMQSVLLSLFGVLYRYEGDYEKSIQNTKKAIALLKQRELSVIDSSYMFRYFNNLGYFYTLKGDIEQALDYYTKASESYEKASENADFLRKIGSVFHTQKKYLVAIDYFRKSLSLTIAQPKGVKNRVNALLYLGSTFMSLGLYDSAVYYSQRAIELPTDYRKAISLGQMGAIHIAQQEGIEAIQYLDEAEKVYLGDSSVIENSPFYLSNIYSSMGDAYLLQENLNTALKFYQKSLVANHPNFEDSLNFETNPPLKDIYKVAYFLSAMKGKAKTLAAFENGSKEVETALLSYQVLAQYMDSLQASHATETASLDWSEDFKQIYEEAIEVAYRLYQNSQDLKYLEKAFSFSEKSKNSLLLENLKATEGKSYAGIPDSLLQKEKDLNIDIAFYGKSLQKAEDEKEEAKIKLYQNYLSKSRLQLVDLRETLERDFPKFQALKYGGETTSIATVQSQLLDKQTAFAEYFVGDSSTFVFVITSNSADLLQLEKPSKLQKKASDFRQTLLNPDAFRQDAKTAFVDYQTKANTLYQAILQPVTAGLAADIQQLIIVPDEFLNSLPLEALTTKADIEADFDFAKMPYLLYDYEVQYAYSANLLLQNQSRQKQLPANADCLAFAPTYESGETFAQRGSLEQLRNATGNLAGTALEIQAIARFFDGDFGFGKMATEKQFKASAHQFGILHLAMHGVPDFDNANFNHLKFSDFNSEIDTLEDNLLHHYEIANMDLQAQLVVLSACETGIGKYEKGEGVYSLARSFMYAGVPSVVMSLWKVSDASTSELMPYFYENLSGGKSKETALHDAKIRFLEESDLEYRHPFYWSAFVLMGDSEEIRRGYGWFWWWGVGVVIIGGFGLSFWRRKTTKNGSLTKIAK